MHFSAPGFTFLHPVSNSRCRVQFAPKRACKPLLLRVGRQLDSKRSNATRGLCGPNTAVFENLTSFSTGLAFLLHSENGIIRIADNSAIKGKTGQDDIDRCEKKLGEVILYAKEKKKKCVCFVTGVPGAGKTLVANQEAGASRNTALLLFVDVLSVKCSVGQLLFQLAAQHRV